MLMAFMGESLLLSLVGGLMGLGAAAYSPAKYGILTELLPPSQLVKANGWIEGLTIGSIILGILMGGQLVGHAVASRLLSRWLLVHSPNALRQIRTTETGVALGHHRIGRPAHNSVDFLKTEYPLPVRITHL